jgi:ATP-binding cassette subfamily C protein
MRSSKWEIGGSVLVRTVKLLDKSDRKKTIAVVILQIGLGFLDLLGVALIGVFSALAVSGIQSNQPGNRVSRVLSFLGIGDQSFQVQAMVLAMVATSVFIFRTFISIYFMKKSLNFLSIRGAKLASSMTDRYFNQPFLNINRSTTQDTVFLLTNGVSILTIDILGTSMLLASDMSLLLVLFIGISLVDPALSVTLLVTFSLIGLFLYKVLHNRAYEIGKSKTELELLTSKKIIEVSNSYREAMVRNRRKSYTDELKKSRYELSLIDAKFSFMPYVSKYSMEVSLIVGAAAIGGFQFILHDAVRAVGTLAIFFAAGSRIAPAILRIQQGSILIRSKATAAQMTLELFDSLRKIEPVESVNEIVNFDYPGFDPNISINALNFEYSSDDSFKLRNINLEVKSGEVLAIVGPSGGGKSTLVDLILGVLTPDKGQILVNGIPPLTAIANWPGSISYVPQNSYILNSTIAENISFGYENISNYNEHLKEAIEKSHLANFVESLSQKINEPVGEDGKRLSGGQRQRIGIARALFTKPKLIVFDEATSALDIESESAISNSILELKGKITIIIIAHRLSSIKHADQILYLENGCAKAYGTLAEVRSKIKTFDTQAGISGL